MTTCACFSRCLSVANSVGNGTIRPRQASRPGKDRSEEEDQPVEDLAERVLVVLGRRMSGHDADGEQDCGRPEVPRGGDTARGLGGCHPAGAVNASHVRSGVTNREDCVRGDPDDKADDDERDPDMLDLEVPGHPRDRRPRDMLAVGCGPDLRDRDAGCDTAPDDVAEAFLRVRLRPVDEAARGASGTTARTGATGPPASFRSGGRLHPLAADATTTGRASPGFVQSCTRAISSCRRRTLTA